MSALARVARKFWDRATSNPAALLGAVIALVRGTGVALYYRLTTRNVRISLPLYHFGGSIRISGPGRVRLAPNCLVDRSAHRGLTIATLDPGALVEIGPRCRLAGATIRCRGHVRLERNVMSGYSLIQDVEWVSDPLCSAQPIAIGEHVWITRQVIVLGGSRIGDGAVIGAASVCRADQVPARTLVTGSPILRPVPLGGLAAFAGRQGS